MTTMIPFDFDGASVRVLDRDGTPWFVLADVCRVLEIANAPHAAARLDDDEKHTLANSDGIADPRAQSFTIINESGLYSLILTSRKPEAKRFKKWVTGEVLPTIRRTGRFDTAEVANEDDIDFAPEPRRAPPAPVSIDDELMTLEARRQSLAEVREARRVFGRGFAQEVWRRSPVLPQAVEDEDGGTLAMTAEQTWWFHRLRAGAQHEGGTTWAPQVRGAALLPAFAAALGVRLTPERRRSLESQMGIALRRLCPEVRVVKGWVHPPGHSAPRRMNVYAFPALTDCRDAFEHAVGRALDWSRPDLFDGEEASVGDFLASAVESDPAGSVKARTLYNAYCRWCAEAGYRPVTETAFGRDLSRRGLCKEKNGTVVYTGLSLAA